MVTGQNRLKHSILMSVGILLLAISALSSKYDGHHPAQGMILVSFWYPLGYFLFWAALTDYFEKRGIEVRRDQST